MLREALSQIVSSYGDARQGLFNKKSAFVKLIEESAVSVVSKAMGASSNELLVEGSAGEGQWADIPWITIMDPRVTTSPTRGYYIVYLFNWRRGKIVLSLNQGSTQVKKEYGLKRNSVLAERAERMRSRIGPLPKNFSVAPIVLNSTSALGRSYEPGHAIGITYDITRLPNEGDIVRDLEVITKAYRDLLTVGGTQPALAEEERDAIAEERPQAKTVTEVRIYRAHRSIERRPSNSKKVKKVHGYTCQACGLKFERLYGVLGTNYIEAHHLLPLSRLEIGIPVVMDIRKDFCVLCANCHRMIHRQNDPSDLAELRGRLMRSKKV